MNVLLESQGIGDGEKWDQVEEKFLKALILLSNEQEVLGYNFQILCRDEKSFLSGRIRTFDKLLGFENIVLLNVEELQKVFIKFVYGIKTKI